jgi:LCP family protein required for cell wall assembly
MATSTRPPSPPQDPAGDPPAPPPGQVAYFHVPPRRRRWPWWVGFALFGLVAIGAALAGGIWVDAQSTLNKVSPNTAVVRAARKVLDAPSGPTVNILILGSDRRAGEPGQGARSDSMIIARLDPDRQAISMMSIPRDLRVDIPGYGVQKINAAYSLGGPQLAIRTVQASLGVRINHYVDINFQGFYELVQKLKGVYVQVDHRYYNPNVPGASFAPIDLHPGYQRLNGNDALSFVRYRHTDTDFVRAARQQLFLLDLKRQASERIGLSDVPGLLKILERNLQTDIDSLGTVISLSRTVLGLPKDRIFHTTLDATEGPSYVEADPTQIANSLERFETPPLPGGGSSLADSGNRVDPRAIRLVVENAGGGFGAAEQVTRLLRRKGYPAVADGDAPAGTPERTAILFRGDRQAAARALSRALKGDPQALLAPADQPRDQPLVLTVGPEFPTNAPFKPPAPKKKAKPPAPPAMRADPAPRQAARALGRVGLRVLAPTEVPVASRLAREEGVWAYHIRVGDGSAPAIVFTFQDARYAGRYWNVQATRMADPPLLRNPTVILKPRAHGRRYQLTYDGKTLRTLAFRSGGVWYWISNTLDGMLTDREMLAIADHLEPLYPRSRARARASGG